MHLLADAPAIICVVVLIFQANTKDGPTAGIFWAAIAFFILGRLMQIVSQLKSINDREDRSGRRGRCRPRPPTTPYVRFRIRRFKLKLTVVGILERGCGVPVGAGHVWVRPGSCGFRQRSTRGRGRSWPRSRPARGPSLVGSFRGLACEDASTAATEWPAACGESTHRVPQR